MVEAWFGLPVLRNVRNQDIGIYLIRWPRMQFVVPTYLTDVNKSTHQVLVAECRNGVLSLLPGRIFHNSRDEVRNKIKPVV